MQASLPGARASKRKIFIRISMILVSLAALFFLIVVPWFVARMVMTRRFSFPDPDAGKTPASYGLQFDGIEFQSRDGLTLRGWYVPVNSRAKGSVIFAHGLNRSRVEFLDQAVFVHELGYNALLFDFRHQGQSEGDLTTLGYRERLDVLAAVAYARQRDPEGPSIVWGISMGGAATLMAAAEATDIDAVIVDSTFRSLEETIARHAKLVFRLPKYPFAQAITYAFAWKGGFWPSAFDLGVAVDQMGSRPILFVGVENDPRMPASIARELHERATGPDKALLIVPGNRHGKAFELSREEFKKAVRIFLERISR